MNILLSICCALIWIPYAESQTLLLTPSNPIVNVGESVTFNCNTGVKDGDWVHLLKQIPGEAPQLIIYNHHSFSSPRYGPGISSDRFTASINSAATEYYFTIRKTEIADTALYYCVKWYGSNTGWVFSQSSKLIVTVDKFPEPAINVFAPYVEDHSTKDNQVITCHVRKMSVSLVNVKWIKDGTTIQDGVSTSQPTRDTDNTFSLSSYLTIPASDLNKDSIYSCWVQQEGSSSFTSQGINLSQC
ncbi:immunoglobulin lambda-1 light chain-like isoform X4 [Pelobates fuscus]|uniref:immunoglobulin lambda-1 light chain-like isoform X4 n=1 Tax=Pelobates fuscus TaxID=191477 RepID=UPI002FE43B94